MTTQAATTTNRMPVEETESRDAGILDKVLENTVQRAYDKIDDPAREAREWGAILQQAGLATTPGGGSVVAMICFTEGMSFREFRRRYHTFDGSLTMKADAAYADFIDAGGKVNWIQMDNDAAIGEFSFGDFESIRIEWTIAEAKEADLYPKKNNWKNYPSDMLFSRCIMRACRRIAPSITAGCYDPDEVPQDRDAAAKAKQSREDRRKELANMAEATDVAGGGDGSVDAEPGSTPPATSSHIADPPPESEPASDPEPTMQSYVTVEQLNQIVELAGQLGRTPDEISKVAVSKYGCKPDLSDLPRSKATEICGWLREAIDEKKPTATSSGT